VTQEMVRRHSRWRLPAGVYNPVVSADGRRWRDYEKAADASAPAAEDWHQDDRCADERHVEVRVPALANGTADSLMSGSLNGLVSGQGAVVRGAPAAGVTGVTGAQADATETADAETADAEAADVEAADAEAADVEAADAEAADAEAAEREPEQVVLPAASPAEPAPPAEISRPAGVGETEPEPDWFDNVRRPVRLEDTRPYGKPGGLAEPRPGTEEEAARDSLAQAVSGRFPDPRGMWIRLINAEGPTEDPFRSTNAVDCALAVMSTWHGEPVVAARRHPEFDAAGKPLLTGETGGVARAEQWLGHRFEYVGHGRRAYVAIAQRLVFGGHGAAAMLITRWPGGGSHAWNAVNCRDEVLWIDAQRGHMAVEPPYEVVTGVFCVVIDREGHRL
jgi:hypothetical protein